MLAPPIGESEGPGPPPDMYAAPRDVGDAERVYLKAAVTRGDARSNASSIPSPPGFLNVAGDASSTVLFTTDGFTPENLQKLSSAFTDTMRN
ncbi:hypothetical protein [Labilithrix luteola]|uniref:hypothetical protein n=1 Tax=Labilithrix luteola TaxID=1391654 RepID=UPI00147282FC|nr:hypothetical protein [Labilithrix luteola]